MNFLLIIVRVVCISRILFFVCGYKVDVIYLSLSGKVFNLSLAMDYISTFSVLMLLICFFFVLSYSKHYFDRDGIYVSLNKIICIFVFTMAILTLTGDFLFTLIFWEYLGVVRFFLILFYGRYLSLRSSIITLVSSRFGDVSIFLLIMMYKNFLINNKKNILLIVLFLFIILTKSARFPFISWLIEAMRAPTPVRSLVHSSTLVAAGVWFSMRYDILLYFNNMFIFSLALLLTIFISGLCCLFFIDLKKIVALSTCNNIAWCITYLIFGDTILALFQLISHGVSKCILFMLVGDIMRGSNGAQAIKCVYKPRLYGKWGIFSLFSVILGLSGAPFIGLFFTKHLLLTKFMSINNIRLSVIILMCVFLSYLYSIRFCFILLNILSRAVIGVLYWFYSGLIMYFWLFIKFLLGLILDEMAYIKSIVRTSLIIFQIIPCCIIFFFYKKNFLRRWRRRLFGSDSIIELIYLMFVKFMVFCAIFFYRWDNFFLRLFKKCSVSRLNVYVSKLLNIIAIRIFLFLMCFIIIYK